MLKFLSGSTYGEGNRRLSVNLIDVSVKDGVEIHKDVMSFYCSSDVLSGHSLNDFHFGDYVECTFSYKNGRSGTYPVLEELYPASVPVISVKKGGEK